MTNMTQTGKPRQTRQKKLVSEILEKSSQPISADQVLYLARRKLPTIAAITVDRILDGLVEKDVARSILSADGVVQFVMSSRRYRYEVVCLACRCIVPVRPELAERMLADIAEDTGFTVENVNLEAYGYCPQCQKLGRTTPRTNMDI